MKLLFTVLLSCYVASSFSSSLHLDIGETQTVFNRVSIPKSDADKITLPTDGVITSFRLTGFFELESKNQLYILYAPLEVQYNFTSEKSFTFNNTNFSDNTATTFNYKFNSYRVGYLWTWKTGDLRYWSGVVGKIRDANTEVIQGNTRDNFSNIGFVPLLSFGFEYYLTENLKLFSHTDALGSSQGSAYDSNIEIGYRLGSVGLSAGKRILGGGAGNDTVFNFAQFDTNYFRLSFDF